MNKLLTIIVVFFGMFLGSFVIYAQTNDLATAPEIIYPIAPLGNCKDKIECFAYCELPSNGKQCLAFAKEHQLLPEEEIRVAEKVLGVKGGPGGCNSKDSCQNYCDDVANIEVCIAFAEENGLMKGKNLEEAKKVRAVIQSGKSLPGNCRNKNACENYCKNSEHIDECLAFAESSGFLSSEELEQAKIFMPLMKKGETPGACKSREECDAYCESDEHFEECISFADKHGMIPPNEREHIEAFKKAGGKGPGGCKGRQCQAFCEQPNNQQACFEWAKENGVLKEDDLRRMEEGRQQIEKVLGDAPPEVASCLEQALGPGGVEKMRSGEFFGGEAIGEKMHACFEGFMSQMGGDFDAGSRENREDGEERKNFSGPGGCKGPDECMVFCKNNMEECQKFAPPQQGMEGNYDNGREDGKENRTTEFQDGKFPSSNEFPGKGEFRGQPGEFPPPQKFPGQIESNGEQYPKDFNQQYDQQYQQEFQKQYDQQFQQQYDQQSQPKEPYQQPIPNTSGDQNYQMTPEQQQQYQQQYQPVQ
ncbi:hypothetical protein A2818_01865 [Candidatus Nomurabacteria bacterium RIFCSPHIGHO2_01_FULL_40_12]|uniref:Uncharacterized protein n=1 Tax=Candidatus Nomurabacteria bacterium RIFCSPHIGHO2_01_FULL_40_12 TaxID=1801737 RepID=A0A1F6V0K6_9BACT|nr:MAG: hypothetical protein A2818_01865 [Candidatus Nomurabacteria bacterium RIFCSPHIGHO2_01_FULL_40_12]